MAGPLELHYDSGDGARRSSFCDEVRLDGAQLWIGEQGRMTRLLSFDFAAGCLRHGNGLAVDDVWIGRRDGAPIWSVLADERHPRLTLAAEGLVSVRLTKERHVLSVDHALPAGRVVPLAMSVSGAWLPIDLRVPSRQLHYASWTCDERRWPLLRVLAEAPFPVLDGTPPGYRLRLSSLAF